MHFLLHNYSIKCTDLKARACDVHVLPLGVCNPWPVLASYHFGTLCLVPSKLVRVVCGCSSCLTCCSYTQGFGSLQFCTRPCTSVSLADHPEQGPTPVRNSEVKISIQPLQTITKILLIKDLSLSIYSKRGTSITNWKKEKKDSWRLLLRRGL